MVFVVVAFCFHLFLGIYPFSDRTKNTDTNFNQKVYLPVLYARCTQCNKMSACEKWTFDRIAKVINIKKVNEEPSADLQIEMFLIFFHFPYSFVTLVPQRLCIITNRLDKCSHIIIISMNEPTIRPTDQINRKTMNRTHRFSFLCSTVLCMLYAVCWMLNVKNIQISKVHLER